jgi:hypothetical protein
MRTTCPLALASLLLLAALSPAAVIHVKTNGNDALPGTSWPDAKRTVNGALAVATANDELWIARGSYAERITLGDGRALYGGFAGTETSRNDRNWRTNFSTLYGSFGGVVVLITNAGPATRVDGLVISGGQAIHGGGIKMVGSGPIIANSTIRNNITDGAGAGLSIWGFHLISSTQAYFPVITNNVIVENQSINSEGDGAGIGVVGSSPVIAWNVIARNTATRNGGGIACWRHSFPVIANNVIEANSASYDELTSSLGGGGIFASATDLDGRPIEFAISAPLIINNVIAANGARNGGGIAVVDSRWGAATIAHNTVVAHNGTGIYWANTWPTNANNIVAFNTRGFERGIAGTSDADFRGNNAFGNVVLGAPANYQNTADRTGTAGNISADPKLANLAIGDFHLQPDSPCVNAGSGALWPTNWPDIDGQPRVLGGAPDIGADESDGSTWNIPTPVICVSPSGDDSDGRSWATAKRSVTNGIALAAQTGGEVWVTQGRYLEHLILPAFVQLYGGFAGQETNRAARNPTLHRSVLDGGGTPPVVYFKNAGYRVSALDGFTVQGGGTYFQTGAGGRGGGIYCRVSGPVIANSLIQSNSLGSPVTTDVSLGGGIYCYLGHAAISNNLIQLNDILNVGDGRGGGIYCTESMPLIVDNLLRTNRALGGSAIYTWISQPHILRNRIEDNWLYWPMPYNGSDYGAILLNGSPDTLVEGNTLRRNIATFGAGVSLMDGNAARVVNNVIADNLAWDPSGFGSGGTGGGLYCSININTTGATVIANNTMVGNSAPPTILGHQGGGLAVLLFTNGLVLANNIIASNSSGIWRDWRTTNQPVLRNNCLNNSNANYINLSAGLGDIQADPQFANRAAGDFRLTAGSPCIDAGTNALSAPTDFDGVARPLDGNTNGVARVDMGAFEFVHPLADTDRDTMLDTAEIIAGTNPTDPASVLRAAIRLLTEQGRVAVSWSSVVGRIYDLGAAPRAAPGADWQTISNNIPANGGKLTVEDAAGPSSNRFYRIGVRVAPGAGVTGLDHPRTQGKQ